MSNNFDNLTPEQRLAEMIHEWHCHANHTEECCWFYDDWPQRRDGEFTARDVYLRKAKAMLGVVDFDTAVNVIKALRIK